MLRRGRSLLVVLLVATLAAVGGAIATLTTSSAPAQPVQTTTAGVPPLRSAAGVFGRIPGIVKQVEPSVVTVLVQEQNGQGEGAGVIWSKDGMIVTNNHVAGNAQSIQVVFASGDRVPGEAGRRRSAHRPRRDQGRSTRACPRPRSRGRCRRSASWRVAIGSPLGFQETVSAGIISGLHRNIPSGGQTPALVDLLQTDAAISPGNSGGALVGRRRQGDRGSTLPTSRRRRRRSRSASRSRRRPSATSCPS